MLQTYDPLGGHDLEEHGSSSTALVPIVYHEREIESSGNVNRAGVQCTCGGAGERRLASAIEDYIDAVYWRSDDDGVIPPMRRIDREGSNEDQISSRFPHRKGVYVPYSVNFFTLPEPRQEGPTKKATRKGLWPYRAKC